jgi:signal transduction histidine kinase
VAEHCIEIVTEIARRKMGRAPEVLFDGHTEASFMYVPAHLEYILVELLKNAFRATAEHHVRASDLPPVCITIATSETDVSLRVSDQGGGFPASASCRLWEYSYTTVDHDAAHSSSLFSLMTNDESHIGVLAGQGFGLPMARVYAEYFGGSLQLVGMHGLGADAHLRLPRLDRNLDNLFV